MKAPRALMQVTNSVFWSFLQHWLSSQINYDFHNLGKNQYIHLFLFETCIHNTTYIPPWSLNSNEEQLLKHLTCDKKPINDIEVRTRDQAKSPEWVNQRKFRLTASNFGLIKNRKRNHDNLVKNLINPNPFSSRHTRHGEKYESVATQKYERFMEDSCNPVTVVWLCDGKPVLKRSHCYHDQVQGEMGVTKAKWCGFGCLHK